MILKSPPHSKGKSPEVLGGFPLKERKYLSREALVNSRGASLENIEKIRAFAKKQSLRIVEVSAARRMIILSGTASQYMEAFQVPLKRYEHPTGKKIFRGRSGPIYVPESLSGVILAVLGLDNRPQLSPHFRKLRPAQAVTTSYTPLQMAKLYDFPTGVDGTGETIGIIELGGGETPTDLSTYFSSLGIPVPKIVVIPVDDATNSPTGDPTGPDGEVMLDIEIAGGIAPGATIALYFAPNTDQGFVHAISTAVNDGQNKPSVISISWGSAESTWTAQAMDSLNEALQDASSVGVTVCCASGDGGSSDGVTDGKAHVDFPASSPFVLGCGGTRIISTARGNLNEVVWNDTAQGGGATGGGVSDVFSLPSWQSGAKVPPSANPGGKVGRGVPDVSGDADPSTGYAVRVDGQDQVFGGTSAVAPLWSGLVALLNQKLGQAIGFVNPLAYQKLYSASPSTDDFHDITSGNNGVYSAGVGWDPCTGLGSPDGQKILDSLLSSS